MTRAYIRVSPELYEKKVFEKRYPLPAVAALIGCFCMAELQPHRGRFRDLTILRALLGPAAKHVAYLIEKGDLVELPTGQIYVTDWDEWQEGDVTVKERMQRIRNRKADRNIDRNSLVSTGRGGAESASGAGQPVRFADAYKAFEQLTGKKPSAKEKDWMDDLSKDFSCAMVAKALYADSDPTAPGFLSRASKNLRGRAA